MNYKDKKILFSTDLSITGYKETLENYLLKKFVTAQALKK